MRRPNFKFIVLALTVCVVLVAAIVLVHRMQFGRSAAALIDQADRAERSGDRAKAAQYLERYLNYVPGNAAVMARFGNLLMADPGMANQTQRIISIFEKALVVDPSLIEVRRKLAGLDLDAGNFPAAETHLKIIQAANPNDGDVALMLGRAQEGLTRDEDAVKSYATARKLRPDLIEAYARLAHLLRRQPSKISEADAVMDAVTVKDGLIAHNKDSALAHLERARYRQEFSLSGVEDDVARALKLDPDHDDVILAAARVAQHPPHVDLDRARALLARGIELHPRTLDLYVELSSLEQTAGRLKEAIDSLKRGVAALPDQIDLRWTLADTLISFGDLQGATEAIAALRERGVTSPNLEYLQARILVVERKWLEAARVLETLAPNLASRTGKEWLAKRAYVLLGQCREHLGQVDRQLAAYRRSLDISLPNKALDVPAHVAIASTLVARGRLEEAVDEYRRVLAIPSTPASVGLDLARTLILRNLQLPPSQRRWSDVEQLLDRIEQVIPGSPDVTVLRSEILVAKDQVAKALGLVHETRVRLPDQVALWGAEAGILTRSGRFDEAQEILNEAEKRFGRPLALRLVRAQCLAQRGGEASIAALGGIERDASDLGVEDRRQLLAALIPSYTRVGAVAQARDLTRRLAEEDPSDLSRRMVLLEQALAQGDEPAARKLLAEMERIDDEGALSRYGQALLLIRTPGREGLVEARRLLGEVLRIRPDWPQANLAKAQVEELDGQFDSALPAYLRTIDLGERSPVAILGAVRLLSRQGRYAQAEQLLRDLPEGLKLPADDHRLAADLAVRSQDFNHAITHARAALAAAPEDYRGSLWLGRILDLAGLQASKDGHADEAGRLFNEAEATLRKAVDLAKDQRIVHVTLVQCLVDASRKNQAREAIEQARRLLPPNQVPLAVAQSLEFLGEPDKTQEAYRVALDASPDDPATLRAAAVYRVQVGKLPEAETTLRRLIDLKTTPPEDADWARRALSVLLASSSDVRKAQQALAMLDPAEPRKPTVATSSQDPARAMDRRARVMVLAAQPDRLRRDEAIRLLEAMVQDREATYEDGVLLVGLYNSIGEWAKSQDQAKTLLATNKNDPRLLMFQANSLLLRKQPVEALVWITLLEKIQPDAPVTIELKAWAFHLLGRKADAVAVIKNHVRGKDAQAISFALILDYLQEPDAAEDLLRQVIARGQQQPQATLTLSDLLGRRGRTADAIKLCDDLWSPATAAVVARCYVRVITAGSTDAATLARIAQRVEDYLATHPNDISTPIQLANLRLLQGKMADAESIYRSLVEKDGNKAIALNNLAWFLAFQPGRSAEALALIDQAIKIRGDSPDLIDTRAIALMAANRSEEAIHDLENALIRGPAADKYFHLAQAYRMVGRVGDATQAMNTALDLRLARTEIHPLERKAYNEMTAEPPRR